MLFAQNGNRVRPIQESEAQKYLSLGYNIKDDKGVVLYEAIPQDMTALRTAFTRHTAQISKLSADLATANAEKCNALAMVESLLAELESVKSKVAELQQEKPKKSRSKKATTEAE